MKLFVTSDIHSYYEPFISALNKAGFDKDNQEHWLIVCGDCFDRGPDSVKLLHFLMQLERKVLIKGNHDLLLDALCQRGYLNAYDKGNGTFRTVVDIGGSALAEDFQTCCGITWNKLAAYRDILVNYFETESYIFVHSWIPMITHFEHGTSKPWWSAGKTFEYDPDWRKASTTAWEESMWGNPFSRAFEGLNKTGKTIVFGHWHCSHGHSVKSVKTDTWVSEFEDDAIWEPYIDEEHKIIGVDRCTAHTNEVNVLVLEDNFLAS
jgi:serine/threonine protein phosphatase 1